MAGKMREPEGGSLSERDRKLGVDNIGMVAVNLVQHLVGREESRCYCPLDSLEALIAVVFCV